MPVGAQAFLGIVLSILSVLEASAQALGVEVQAPPGWTTIDRPPIRAFAPPDLQAGESALLIVWPAEKVVASEFSAWFERAIVGPGERVLRAQPTQRRAERGLEILFKPQVVDIPAMGPVFTLSYGVSSGSRVARAAFVANRDYLATRYAVGAEQFFGALKFVATEDASAAPRSPTSAAPPSVKPPSNEKGIAVTPAAGENNSPAGLFYRIEVTFSGPRKLEAKTRLFLPGNRISRTFPFGGGNAFDPSRCNPDMCGSYRLEAGQLTVRWDNGRTDRYTFASAADGIEIDGALFKPARAMTEAGLVGEWADAGNPLSNVYRFERDGSFSFGLAQGGVKGRYRVEGLTLILAFQDGTEQRRTLFAASSGEPVGRISVEADVYTRK
jgi:hypothetical protein